MRPCAVLVIALVLCSLGTAKDIAKTDKTEEGASRKGRLFFLTNLLSGPAALASGLGNALSSIGSSLSSTGKTSPSVIYVAKQPIAQTCTLPLFTRGCPAGYVCASAPGGNQCVPKYPEGFSCQTGFQCVSGVCRDGYCVKDDCPAAGGPSNCPRGQECVSTRAGNRCQAKSNKDQCPILLEQTGCPENQYCAAGPDGRVCKSKLQVGDTCTVNTQCLSDTCRNRKCKADACPMVDMSIDCMPTQYCSPGENGNMCVAKKEKGASCSARLQCKSNVCDERGFCIEDKCPNPYSEERCLPTQFCSPAPYGNECIEKRNNNEACRQNAECKSKTCRNGVCKANECQNELSSEGCNMLTQFCMNTANGNECVMKLANDQACMTAAQCMSGNCVNGQCSASAAGSQRAIGATCSMPSQCVTGNCVMQRCAASRNSINGVCMDNDDCQSNSCVMNVCAVAMTTTSTSSVTTTTAATTTTTTTTAATTTTLKTNFLSCTVNSECQSNRCISTLCQPTALLTLGQPCTIPTAALCLSNNCAATDATPVPSVCIQGTGTTGSVCTNYFQCASGICNTPAFTCA